ncbi:hypothetical protein KY289_035934 [Solanum tuberosum]|nr:hypothetical protein KY289_035934 [Solanum tuberosum]
MMFFGLGVRANKRDETYLTTFLSFWLCTFVLPNKEGEFVRPGTFKMASLMASGRKISLAIPALVDTARPIPVVHLEGSGKVCKNKVLNIGMPSSLGAKENNIATPQREKSQDSGEYLSCSYLMKPPPVTQVKKRLPYVSYNEVKDDLGYEAHKHTLTSMSIFDRKKVILDTQKDFTSTFLGCY